MEMFSNTTEGTTWGMDHTDDYVLFDNITDDMNSSAMPPPPLPGPGPLYPRRPPMSAQLLKTIELIHTSMDVHKYVTPVLLVMGLIGNTFSLLIFHRPFMRKSSAAVYFSALAVADTVALIQHANSNWVPYFYPANNPLGIHFMTHLDFSDIFCKISYAIFPFSLEWPAWLVVALTVERVIITTFPLQGKLWCTRRTAVIVVTTISLLLFSYHFLTIAVYGFSTGKCDLKAHHEKFALVYGYWITLTLYTLIPSPLLILLNGIMIFKLSKARRRRKLMTGATANKKSNDAISKATIAAVTVSVIYFFLTLPSTTLNAINVMTDLANTHLELWIVHFFALIIRTSNNSINFFVYLATYPRVRTEFVAMVTTCCPQTIKAKALQSDTDNSKVTETFSVKEGTQQSESDAKF